MSEHWSQQYIGLPWKEKGRTRAGIDCYGLVRLILAEQCGIRLPSYTGAYASTEERAQILAAITAGSADLARRIERHEVRPFDVVEMMDEGVPTHLGIVSAPGRMIHIPRRRLSEMPRWDRGAWADKVVGFWRPNGVPA